MVVKEIYNYIEFSLRRGFFLFSLEGFSRKFNVFDLFIAYIYFGIWLLYFILSKHNEG